MASFCSFLLATFIMFMVLALALSPHQIHAQFSTISAAPALLPSAPVPLASTSAPSLSPDITPLFPTPGGGGMAPSPAESSLPTIPSSPSPPNPDDLLAPGPGMALPPAEALPASSSAAVVSTAGPLNFTAFVSLLLFCLMQLARM